MHISELFNVNINWLKNGDGEIFYNTNSNNVSDKENVSYVTEQPAKFGIPFFNNPPLSNHKMNINEPDLYISVPETEECYFAVKAPENSAAPVLRNDIVFFAKPEYTLTDSLYIIRDSYNDVLIRWYSTKLDLWYSKRPEYADIPNRDICVLGILKR